MNVTRNEVPRSAEFPVPAGASTAPASIHVRRRIAAPTQMLFEAWLDPESVTAWMQTRWRILPRETEPQREKASHHPSRFRET